MAAVRIKYTFNFDDGSSSNFDVKLNRDLLFQQVSVQPPPAWTKLRHHQCRNCPLNEQQSPHCPVAVNLNELIPVCDKLTSHDELAVVVDTEERTISQRITAQRAISALMGLIMATSGCPRTSFFKAMARFHLPFSSPEETIYRVTSTFLLAQYFKQGLNTADVFAELEKIYSEMRLVNSSMADRLRSAVKTDASLNAITLLDVWAQTVLWEIDDSLPEVRHLFEAYLDNRTAA